MAEKKTKIMSIHPLCRLFSSGEDAMTESERNELREDIRAHGVKIPILVNKKKDTILDGRTRWMIASELGIQDKVPMEVFTGKDEDIKTEIVARNIYRRHLSPGQRAALVNKLLGKQFEAEAKEEQRKAGRAKAGKERTEKIGGAFKKGNGESVAEKHARTHAEKLAKTAGVTEHVAKQAIAAEKAGMTDDVIQKRITVRAASKKGGKSRRGVREKDKPLTESRLWGAFDRMLRNNVTLEDQKKALQMLRGFIDDILRGRKQLGDKAAAPKKNNSKSGKKK